MDFYQELCGFNRKSVVCAWSIYHQLRQRFRTLLLANYYFLCGAHYLSPWARSRSRFRHPCTALK